MNASEGNKDVVEAGTYSQEGITISGSSYYSLGKPRVRLVVATPEGTTNCEYDAEIAWQISLLLEDLAISVMEVTPNSLWDTLKKKYTPLVPLSEDDSIEDEEDEDSDGYSVLDEIEP